MAIPVQILNHFCLLLGFLVLGLSVRLGIRRHSKWHYRSEYWTKFSWDVVLQMLMSLLFISIGLYRIIYQQKPKSAEEANANIQPIQNEIKKLAILGNSSGESNC